MPALCFPNPDALRLALASGIVPAEAARGPVRAGTDDHGRPWVEVPAGFPKDAAAALGRIGVTLHGPGLGPPISPASCWAELVPLRPHAAGSTGPVLIDVADDRLARVASEIRRVCPQPIGIRLLPDARRVWLLLAEPPLSVALGADVEVFAEQAPRVWVRAGWQHPLEDGHLAAPPGSVAVLRPSRAWQLVPAETFRYEAGSFTLPGVSGHPEQGGGKPFAVASTPLPVTLGLRPSARWGETESLWVMPGDPTVRLRELAHETDERVLERFAIAFVSSGDTTVTVLRAGGQAPLPTLSPGCRGFVPHPSLAGLHLPAGFSLVPDVRSDILARVLQVGTEVVAWVEAKAGRSFEVRRVPMKAFHPVGAWVHYRSPAVSSLAPLPAPADPFAFSRFQSVADARSPTPDPARPPVIDDADRPAMPDEQSGLLERLGNLFRGKSGPQRVAPRRTVKPSQSPKPAGRLGEKLASPQALLLGNEWSARRSGLERRILVDLPRLPPADRARVWSELADVYVAVGNPGDAAVCWLSAVWDADPPPNEWPANWLRAEAKAARVAREGFDPDAVLCVPPSAGTARVAAAYLTWAGGLPQPPADLPAHVPHLLALVDAHEPELPARAIWLARLTAARVAGGDALGLARCRDRVFRRLTDRGPGLDLDAPTFLRFHGAADGDRFQAARDWLARVRDPIHKWLGRMAARGGLQWAGLDPEVRCTRAYADLLLAWGLSKLGDRGRARDLEAAAADELTRASGDGVDPAVHRVLRLAFEDRIRAARDGRPDRPGLPLEAAAELPRLDDLGRYAVDKLRAHSGVLEPVDLVNPYRGRDLCGFLGTDALGERLGRLLARPDLAPDPAEVRALLAAADPTAGTLPRIVFALLEVAPRLEPAAAAEAVGWTGPAVERLPEWLRSQATAYADPATAVAWYGARAISAAAHVAGRFNLTAPFARLAADVRAAAESPGGPLVSAVERTASQFFRTLRRLGLTRQAAELVAALGEPVGSGPRELGLAVGSFAAGNDDVGNRVLDAARDRLFVAGVPDDRERTAVALAYAAALGHAPPRVALGRLEELFLRLDGVAVRGATNRYYTLRPLELIDTAVRAVVSEDFVLGPDVRGWLDDDEHLIRRRIGRDLAAALTGAAGIS